MPKMPTLLAVASLALTVAAAAAFGPARAAPERVQAHAGIADPTMLERIAPYRTRFGRARPVIAVIGENGGTELTDYAIPYGILRRADVGEVVALATKPGPMTMRPALRLQPQATIAAFDARYPDGADYLIVPAVVHRDDPVLLGWVRQQAAKGATLVSICDGALVLGNAGLLAGHRATAHWATRDYRRKTFPDVRWLDNRRYVADGPIVSSAGISAAIPTALALVEAIAGHDRAAAVARTVNAADWGSAHDSELFRPKLGRNIMAFASTQYLNGWLRRPQALGLAVSAGADEVALALAADAYTRTGRARAYAVSASPAAVTTAGGLAILPDHPGAVDAVVPLPAADLPAILGDIARRYGRATAYGVALDFEYPGFHG